MRERLLVLAKAASLEAAETRYFYMERFIPHSGFGRQCRPNWHDPIISSLSEEIAMKKVQQAVRQIPREQSMPSIGQIEDGFGNAKPRSGLAGCGP